MEEADRLQAQRARMAGYYAKQGSLWQGSRMIGLPMADHVAQEYGFMFAECLVKALEEVQAQEHT